MRIAKGMNVVSVRLPKEDEARLEAMARKVGLTKTALARRAILARMEDMEDYDLAARAYEEQRASGEQAWSAETVEAMLAARRGELVTVGEPDDLLAELNKDDDD